MNRLKNLSFSNALVPLILAVLCFFAHGLLIPWLGIYSDDWTFLWTTQILGNPGELRYFTLGNNRPIWGFFFHTSINLLGNKPWILHLYGIACLWITSLLVWWLVRLIYPNREKTSFYAAALFAVYPGFQIQLVSLMVGNMWLVLASLLFSLCMSILAIQQPRRYVPYATLAVLSSTINLLSFEYFIMLELIRLMLLWLVIGRSFDGLYRRVLRTFLAYLPYGLLLAGVLVWRLFFFPLQTDNHQLSLLDQLQAQPVTTLLTLVNIVLQDVFWDVTFLPWVQAFRLPFQANWREATTLIYGALTVFSSVLAFFFVARLHTSAEKTHSMKDRQNWEIIALGMGALFAGGLPFWMTYLNVLPHYWNSRFTMPFAPGVALLFAGLLNLIPLRRLQWLVAALLIGSAVGAQFQIANDFRRDWKTNTDIIWQISWRIPGLEPGTTFFSNELPLKYYTDNIMSAELNWITSRGKQNYDANVYLAYISEMLQAGYPIDRRDVPFQRDMYSIDYHGNTSKVVGIHYRPESCLRLLDPRFDPWNTLLPKESQSAARLSDPSLVQENGQLLQPDEMIFGREPIGDWCHTVIRADLARYQGDWEQVASLGDSLDHTTKTLYRDPMIAVIFIEGYAHAGNIDKAMDLTRRAVHIYPYFEQVLCRIWRQIDLDLGDAQDKEASINDFLSSAACAH